jgi:hypothetical protein
MERTFKKSMVHTHAMDIKKGGSPPFFSILQVITWLY